MNNKVSCEICGKVMSSINNRHLLSHGITAQEYKRRFPNKPLLSEHSSYVLSQRSIKSNSHRKGVRRSKEELEAIKTGIKNAPPRKAWNKGVPCSDENKKILSEKAKESFSTGKRIHHMLGNEHTQQTKDKISNALFGRIVGPEIAAKALETKIKNGYDFGAPMRGKTHSEEAKSKIGKASKDMHRARRPIIRIPMIEKIEKSNLILSNSIDEDIFHLQCKRCNYIFTRSPQMFQPSKWHKEICDQCYPISKVSNGENEVALFIEQMIGGKSIRSDMETISPLELDIRVGNIAIEYCGLYWHSEGAGKSKWYHRKKLELCEQKDVRLITIFEDEWINKQKIVKSVITNIFINNFIKINARNCSVQLITPTIGREFLNENHIQGKGRAKLYYGLFLKNDLVSVMSFSDNEPSRRSTGWDINRFCSKIGTNVRGGAGKLFSYFVKQNNPDKVVSYADLRYGLGNVYGKLGFSYIGKTVPNYWYFRGANLKRHHRYGLRKNSNDKPELTEWQNRQEQGWNRIWDCGHAKWEWTSTNNIILT